MEVPRGMWCDVLGKISLEIDEYYKGMHTLKIARSTDIYEFIKRRKLLFGVFPTGRDFNRFLRKVYNNEPGLLKAVIPNCDVDSSNPNFYQWKFYRKELKISNEVNAESIITPSSYYKEDRNIQTNNGDFVRSHPEKYIYNRLLNEQNFKVYYEKPFGIKGCDKTPDFTVWNLLNDKIYRWEHFGMLEDLSYAAKADEKIQWYKDKGFDFIENGGRLIITTYLNDHKLQEDVEKIIILIKEK